MRRVIAVPCEGETLAATLDTAPGTTGLLIVSGGNVIRCGAHRGMAMLAQRLAARGVPVLRYDRRGVGDSSGINGGFLSARPDLIAAAAAFRAAMPAVTRLVGFGNCDAASTLALFGRDAGLDAVVLANPWLAKETDDLPPAAAIRARYSQRLRDPREWRRLLGGGVNIRGVFRGLRKIHARPVEAVDSLETRVMDALGGWGQAATVIVATKDATGLAFTAAARHVSLACRTVYIPTASHSFAGAVEAAGLEDAIVTVLHSPSSRT
ncbi:hydrolase 1, exosortase A system-associated [Sphingomonas ginsenosidivorax]|uniref:Hydrolase 1, exosortase A system-associated n=1 Tax=Sphingomonas ginsenosidivorax TaxID=862135 RepID=A0A5C6UFN3_9SPHN|nr:hydrolase 1, exosortase A system-associated [Sphingomonas ginsenosidivorax]TXC70845.1 hydrolase 1, exosortase A system-associated [Sphingomonas ginsenosidivorax]